MKKVKFAQELECSPSSITAMVSRGMPAAPDGSLDRDKCLRWIARFTTGRDGGWSEGKRGAGLQERAQALLAGETKGAPPLVVKPQVRSRRTTADELVKNVAAECWSPPAEKPAAPGHRPAVTSGTDTHQAVIDTLRTITAPPAVLKFAALAIRAGCTPMQAFIVAQHFMIAPCLDLTTISADDLIDFPAPTQADWRGLLGKGFNLNAADSEYDLVAAPAYTPDA